MAIGRAGRRCRSSIACTSSCRWASTTRRSSARDGFGRWPIGSSGGRSGWAVCRADPSGDARPDISTATCWSSERASRGGRPPSRPPPGTNAWCSATKETSRTHPPGWTSSRGTRRSASTRDRWWRSPPRTGIVQVHPRRVVAATGGVEVHPVFPGNDLPGVMLGRAAAGLVERGVMPGRRAVVVVGHDEGIEHLRSLQDAAAFGSPAVVPVARWPRGCRTASGRSWGRRCCAPRGRNAFGSRCSAMPRA